MGAETKPNQICPHEEIKFVSDTDPSLGYIGTCSKLLGRCAYFDKPEELGKIGGHENCFIFKNINK